MRKRLRNQLLMRTLLSILVMIALIHCGVKAPPLPPLPATPQSSDVTASPSPSPHLSRAHQTPQTKPSDIDE